MKSTFSIIAASALLLFVSCGENSTAEGASDATQAAEKSKQDADVTFTDGMYQIDAASSTVSWKGTKITGSSHEGTVGVYKGSVKTIDQSLNSGFLAIDMNNIVCTDEGMDDDGKANLVGHLKSDDFFGVEQFPMARLELDGVKVKEGTAVGFGKIIIREIAQPINVPLTISKDGDNMVVDANFSFDRSKHDVKFRSGSFPDLFPDLGDKLINDEIEINVHLVGVMR